MGQTEQPVDRGREAGHVWSGAQEHPALVSMMGTFSVAAAVYGVYSLLGALRQRRRPERRLWGAWDAVRRVARRGG